MATNEEILEDFCNAHGETCTNCAFFLSACCPFENEKLEAALYNLMGMVRDGERLNDVKILSDEDFDLEEELGEE